MNMENVVSLTKNMSNLQKRYKTLTISYKFVLDMTIHAYSKRMDKSTVGDMEMEV